MPSIDDEDKESRAIAMRMEWENPNWMVIFGVYTKQFICIPLFPVPPGTIVVGLYPDAVVARMRKVEIYFSIIDHSK